MAYDLSPAAQRNIQLLGEISQDWAKEGRSKGKERETVFVWMDGVKWQKWLGNMYGIGDVEKSGGTSIVVVDHGVSFFLE